MIELVLFIYCVVGFAFYIADEVTNREGESGSVWFACVWPVMLLVCLWVILIAGAAMLRRLHAKLRDGGKT